MKMLTTLFCLVFTSCITSKPITNILDQEKQKGKEDTNAEFVVIKRDGTRIIPAKLKFAFHGTSSTETNFMWVDGVKMRNNEILGYQTKSGYTAITRNSKWKDAREMDRIRHGKINLYITYGGGPGYAHYYYYYFDKDGGDVQSITYELLSQAVSDKPQVFALLQTLFPTKKITGDMNGGIYNTKKSSLANLSQIFDAYNQQET